MAGDRKPRPLLPLRNSMIEAIVSFMVKIIRKTEACVPSTERCDDLLVRLLNIIRTTVAIKQSHAVLVERQPPLWGELLLRRLSWLRLLSTPFLIVFGALLLLLFRHYPLLSRFTVFRALAPSHRNVIHLLKITSRIALLE